MTYSSKPSISPRAVQYSGHQTSRRQRVRYEGGFSPLNISGLLAWYDFSDASTLFTDTGRTTPVASDGDAIKGVTDKSGTAKHLSEATNGPAYKTGANGINNLSVALADGTNDRLNSGNFTQAQPLTMIAVGNHGTGAVEQDAFFTSTGASPQILMSAAGVWALYSGLVATNSVDVDTNVHVVVGVFNSSSSALYLDGGTSGALDPSTGGFSANGVLLFTDTVRFWTGRMGEALLYSGALSKANINIIGEYLADKWNTTWTTVT